MTKEGESWKLKVFENRKTTKPKAFIMPISTKWALFHGTIASIFELSDILVKTLFCKSLWLQISVLQTLKGPHMNYAFLTFCLGKRHHNCSCVYSLVPIRRHGSINRHTSFIRPYTFPKIWGVTINWINMLSKRGMTFIWIVLLSNKIKSKL